MSKVVEPIRKQLVVEAPLERCFRVFTERVEVWWPAEHHIGASPIAAITIEPRVGGRWFETGVDGTQCDWGRVLTWDPPRRLVLAWQLTAEWKFDPDFVTEVEVRFTGDGPRRTIVDFEHRDLERFGEHVAAMRGAMDGGWGGILDRFVRAAAG
jgi:uncharacterized protein YndB with AHSA1/START domain